MEEECGQIPSKRASGNDADDLPMDSAPDAWDGAVVRLQLRTVSLWTSDAARSSVIDRFVTGRSGQTTLCGI